MSDKAEGGVLANRIYQGDALAAMATLDDHSIDALITDPPYCSGAIGESQRTAAKLQGVSSRASKNPYFKWFKGDNMTTGGLVALLRAVAFEATRVVKPTGSLLVFMDWRMAPSVIPAIESSGVRYQALIVWDKGSMGLGTGFRPRHELVAHFTFGSPEYHDLTIGNVLQCKRVSTGKREHATEKPIGLLAQLVRVVAPPGGIVLDTFAGSGSTGVAAREEGRGFVLVERDPELCKVAARRCSAPVQARLFAPHDPVEQVPLFDTPGAPGRE